MLVNHCPVGNWQIWPCVLSLTRLRGRWEPDTTDIGTVRVLQLHLVYIHTQQGEYQLCGLSLNWSRYRILARRRVGPQKKKKEIS